MMSLYHQHFNSKKGLDNGYKQRQPFGGGGGGYCSLKMSHDFYSCMFEDIVYGG